jgi:hypothetical protein
VQPHCPPPPPLLAPHLVARSNGGARRGGSDPRAPRRLSWLNPAPADLGGACLFVCMCDSGGGARVCLPLCVCARALATVVACGGGRGGPLHIFYFKNYLHRELLCPHGAHLPRWGRTALGEGAFAGWSPPRALDEGSAVRKQPFAERMPALGEGSQSGSGESRRWIL